MYQLEVIAGPDSGKKWTLNTGPDLFMGRAGHVLYRLTDPRVSRTHCQILLDEDQVTVICLGGSGGTLVNGKPIERQALKLGDVVQIGDTQMRFTVGDYPADVVQEAV